MRISLKVTICFMTASVSLLSVSGNNEGLARINCDNTPVNQTAHVGGSVTINCNYSRAEESNVRYLCKEDEKLNCRNMIETHSSNYTKRGRFSLTDNKQQRVYTVTLSGLTKADAGRYKCAMENSSFITCSTEVHLHILNWDDVKSEEISGDTGDTIKIQCSYPISHEIKEKSLCKGRDPSNCMMVGVVVSLTLLVIAVVVLILCRHKLPRTQGGSSEQRTYTGNNTEGNHGDYEEIEENLGNTLPSIYVSINPPADHLHYANVYFQKDSSDPGHHPSSSCRANCLFYCKS
eukprot:superscaffoldBa00001627_g11351